MSQGIGLIRTRSCFLGAAIFIETNRYLALF
jgi:hypothetical protein